MKFLLPLLVVLLAACSTFDDKKPDYTITFHTVSSDMDPPKTMFPLDLNGKRMYFKVVPEFSQQNIIGFHAFPSTTGNGKGAVLHLDFRGKAQLELISRTRRDEYLLVMVNAKPVDYLVLDAPVLDGILTIWQGIPDDVIKKMEKHIQHMDKKQQTPSMSSEMDMPPTTRTEKKQAYEQAKEAERQSRSGKPPKNEVKSLQLPQSQVSPQIPVEGAPPPLPPLPQVPGSPPPSQSPEGNLPLPKP
ncbi:MAG TPA: hypothetical protein VGH65_00285 [Verrucomicrobiaceae bacterium]|jgi:hypothetical protein